MTKENINNKYYLYRNIFFVYIWIFFIVLICLSILYNGQPHRVFAALWVVWALSWIFSIFTKHRAFPSRYYKFIHHNNHTFKDDPAIARAKMRLANGEITEEEYHKIVNAIKK